MLLDHAQSLGITPDFAIHHRYPEWTDANNPAGSDNDALLLQCSTNWAVDAADLRQQLSDYFGPAGTNVELLCTENNSDAGAQGKQSTSLVNGLYYADSLGQLMQTEFNALIWWDLRNSTDTSGWFDQQPLRLAHLRRPGHGQRPDHPASHLLCCQAHAVLCSARRCHSRRVQRLPAALGLCGPPRQRRGFPPRAEQRHFQQFQCAGCPQRFHAGRSRDMRSYGIPQDEATRTNGSAQAQDIAVASFTSAGTSFTYVFPPLSLTLFTLAPAASHLAVLPPVPRPGGQLVLQLQGQPQVRYLIQSSTNLSSTNLSAWTTVSTNTLAASTLNFTNPVQAGIAARFWRALWQP